MIDQPTHVESIVDDVHDRVPGEWVAIVRSVAKAVQVACNFVQ
jgi:hypothetical protein